jgi:hypothetical protein
MKTERSLFAINAIPPAISIAKSTTFKPLTKERYSSLVPHIFMVPFTLDRFGNGDAKADNF